MVFSRRDYKRYPNKVGGRETALPEDVPAKMQRLLSDCNAIKGKLLGDIIEFPVRFERIHPFPGGKGRAGGLLGPCLTVQDRFKKYLDDFRIGYSQACLHG